MSRARELAKAGGVQQRIAGFSSHVGMSTFLADVHMESDLTVDGNADIGGNLTVTGTTTFNGGTLTLGDANTDNVVFGGEVDSNIIPDDDNSFDLGSASKEWKDLYVDGVAYLDSVESDGGSFGNIQIGETGDNEIDTESGNLTLDSAGGTVIVDDNLDVKSSKLTVGTGSTDVIIRGTAQVTGELKASSIGMGGSIIPDADDTYDLGSPTKMWRDVYIGPGSLYINGQKVLEENSSNIIVSCDADQNLVLQTSGSGDLELDPTGSGLVQVKGALQIQDGNNITNSSGNDVTFGNRIGVDSIISRSSDTNLTLSGEGSGKVRVADDLEVTGSTSFTGGLTVGTNGVSVTTVNATGISSFTSNLNVTGILDVDGATTLDGLTVAEDATFSAAIDVDGHTNLDNVSVAGVTTFSTPLANANLANSSLSYGGVSVSLGGSDATPAFDLTDATNYPTSSLTGTITNTQLAGSIANSKLSNSSITIGSDSIALGGSRTDINGLTSLDVDNVTIDGNTVTTSSGNLTIDSNGGTTTIADNAVISGNLTVNGTTTTINSTTVAIDDKNFQVATGAADDAAANGAGFTVDSGDGDKTFNFEATGDNWGASENLNLASGKVYKINNTSVLSATTLGSGVVNSSLTTLGTIATGVWQGTAIENAYIANSTMSVGGVTLTLGGTDATPAFNLSDATNYPTSSLSGTITNAQLAGSIEGTKLENSGVSAGSYGGSSAIPVITVDAQGLVTSATTSSIDSTQIAQLNTSVACSDTGSNGLVTVTADGSTVAVFDQNLLTVTGSILPDANGTRDLGASGTRWANVYSSDLDLSNQAKGANSVDGTWGSYLIEEGEDHLFLTNRRNGKKFRFVLEEV